MTPIHSTTILAVQHNGQVAIGGDGPGDDGQYHREEQRKENSKTSGG